MQAFKPATSTTVDHQVLARPLVRLSSRNLCTRGRIPTRASTHEFVSGRRHHRLRHRVHRNQPDMPLRHARCAASTPRAADSAPGTPP